MSAAAASSAWAKASDDRAGMIAALASLPVHPESVPINMLVQVEGTPLAGGGKLDPLEFVRTIAVARIAMPKSVVRLSAGREDMSEETQALCFLAGANSIFYGPKLLTTPNPGRDRDMALLDKLGLCARWSGSACQAPPIAGVVSDRLPRRRSRRGAAPRRQSDFGALVRHRVPLAHAVRERHRLAGDGPARRLFRVQGRRLAALAAVPHHRHPRRLHHLLGVLARYRPAL